MDDIVRTFNGDVCSSQNDTHPGLSEQRFVNIHKTFVAVQTVIQSQGECTFTVPLNIRIGRIKDHANSICVTHRPTGYGWGYYYGNDIGQDVDVEFEDDRTFKIVPAKYVWVTFPKHSEKWSGANYPRCFNTQQEANAWGTKTGCSFYKIRHYKSSATPTKRMPRKGSEGKNP